MRPGPARHETVQRPFHRSQERGRHAHRHCHSQRVAVAAGVLDRDPALLAGDADDHRAPRPLQRREPLAGGRRFHDPRRRILRGQVAQPAQQVVQSVHGSRGSLGRQRLQSQLQVGQRGRVDQVAQLLLAEQLAQQVAVQGQRAGPPLRQGRVALVHVGGQVVEEQRAGERRGRDRLHFPDLDLTSRHSPEHLAQRRQVEEVGQAFAIGLDDDRERAVPAGHGQQAGRTLPLLPERRPRAGPAPRQEQRPRRVLAETGREHGRASQPPDDQVLDLVGRREEESPETEAAGARRPSFESAPAASPSGRRIAIPSSDQIVWAPWPSLSSSRASIASAHGA